MDFIPGAVPLTFLLHGRMFHRHLRSPVYFLLMTMYLAPCFQSYPSMLMGLLATCFLIILPVVMDFILGNKATTSSPSRQIAWSSQNSPSPHSSHSVSILSLQSLPHSSQSYLASIILISLSSSSSWISSICSWQSGHALCGSSLYGHFLHFSFLNLCFFQFWIISMTSLFAFLVLASMSSVEMHSNLFSILFAMLSRKFDTELLSPLVLPEHPVTMGLDSPGDFLWSFTTTYMVDRFSEWVTLASRTLPCWPCSPPVSHIFVQA